MKKHVLMIVSVLAAGVLAACGGIGPDAGGNGEVSDAGADPDAPILQTGGVVSATGIVVPSEEASLAFETGGQLVELNVEVGDEVQEGDVLARLDASILEAQIANAEASVGVAQANLDLVTAGPRDAQVAEQEANVDAAQASAGVAQGELADLLSGPSDVEIAQAQLQVQSAFLEWWSARRDRNYLRDAVNDPEPQTIEVFFTDQLVEEAQEELNFALLDLEVAQEQLEELLDGADQNQINAARAEAGAAGADVDAAESNLAVVEAGARAGDIAFAEASVEQARAALEQARAALEQTVVRAPFSGTISEVFLLDGQFVGPGSPAFTIAQLDTLRVETTDLNEIDVAAIEVGDTAIVTFDALPDVEVQGTVVRIASRADEGTGVNFRVIIELDEIPEDLRWGMTAFVDIPVE